MHAIRNGAQAIVLLGPQGVGKTTLLEVAVSMGFTSRIMSDLLKARAQNDPVYAELALSYQSQGLLVPDTETMRVLAEDLDGVPFMCPLILDSVMRTPNQVSLAKQILERRHCQIIVVRFKNITIPICKQRIAKRVQETIAKGLIPRMDDVDPVKVDRRLGTYFGLEQEIVERLEQERISIHSIDGGLTKSEVAESFGEFLQRRESLVAQLV